MAELEREHVVCTTDEAIISVDLESFQQRSSMALGEKPGALCVARDVAVVCAAKDASLIGYGVGARGVDLRSRVPERLGAAALTPCGAYLAAGGAASGRLYAWELWSGRLARAWEGHFRGVSALCWSEGGDALLSGGEDGVVAPWDACVVVDADALAAPSPLFDHWSEHSMPVTAVLCRGLRVFSCALDRTARVRDLASGRLVCTLSVDEAPRCAALDVLDAYLLLGCESGLILRVDLDAQAAASSAAATARVLDARGATLFEGAGDGGDGALAGLFKARAPALAYAGHAARVTGVAQHPSDHAVLVSASDDGSLRVWDAESRQCVRVVALGPNAPPLRHLVVLPDRPRGGQHASLAMAPLRRDDAERPAAIVPVAQLRAGGEPAPDAAPRAGGDADALRAELARARDDAAKWREAADALWREVRDE